MTKKLAVYCPRTGARSLTFIRRHLQDLWPGNTVALTKQIILPPEATWSVDCPVYKINNGIRLIQGGKRFLGRIFGKRWGMLKDYNGVRNFLVEHKADVLLGEFLDSSWPIMQVARDLDLPFFVHAHGIDLSATYLDPLWRKRYEDYRQADGVIIVNEVMRTRLLSIGISHEKIHLIPYGVDVPTEPAIRPEKNTVRCFAVGRMVAKKAPLMLLEAFRRALKELSNLHLDFIGEGVQYADVVRFIDEHDLGDKVTLHGGQYHHVVLDFMKQADIFLQHSITDVVTGDEEGLPVAILEAMSFALPVVSTRHAGIPYAVEEGVSGYLVDEGDVQGMAKFIVSLGRDAALRETMGRSAWARAREKFSWEVERAGLCRVLGLKEG